ncbi:hypothetical protein EZS27_009080 [termite gut metagenome]|uniref:Glycosylase n=1 Tax=termite gut metagenome TaxID=433724 RepID=A0A5J4SCY1_9ZZZZ
MKNVKMKSRIFGLFFFVSVGYGACPIVVHGQTSVPQSVMQQVYEEIKTPYKYGLVLIPEEGKMIDSPSVFRYKNLWYMTYIVFDGQGYETWIAQSVNLLEWQTLGKIMSFTANTWDANQKAGYIALQDPVWGGSYVVEKYKGRYWMSYLGGATQGYEAGTLGIGVANTSRLTEIKEWKRLEHPVMMPGDADARWYDNLIIYKSTVIHDRNKTLGHPFVMYYNAKSKKTVEHQSAERIAVAVSDDMTHWQRYGDQPVIDHHSGITGDAFITKINDLWVMFYFGAFWKPAAFNRFACSYDLINWTDWNGEDLVAPSEPYDAKFAHKSYVVKHNGVVYHFYCAVDNADRRGIAVATSKNMGN